MRVLLPSLVVVCFASEASFSDEWRIVNAQTIADHWVLSEVTFYSDTACTQSLSSLVDTARGDYEGTVVPSGSYTTTITLNPDVLRDGTYDSTGGCCAGTASGTKWAGGDSTAAQAVGGTYVGYMFVQQVSVKCVELGTVVRQSQYVQAVDLQVHDSSSDAYVTVARLDFGQFGSSVGYILQAAIGTTAWTTVATIGGDPHARGSHGDAFAFKGDNGATYAALSAVNVSMNLRFSYRTFKSPYSKQTVHGSFITGAYWVARTPSGLLRIQHEAADWGRVLVLGAAGRTIVTAGPAHTFGGVVVSLRGKTSIVSTPSWVCSAESTHAYPHANQLRMNIKIQPRRRSLIEPPAHGLLGQTFDTDTVPVFGMEDDYTRRPEGTVTTRAQGEGAIEGVASDYQVDSPFSTQFRFSRFDAVTAAPRNASGLAGRLLPHVNFQGADLDGGEGAQSPYGCHLACVKHPTCLAFTFITANVPRTDRHGHRRCWLKGAGYRKGEGVSMGTVSGIPIKKPR